MKKTTTTRRKFIKKTAACSTLFVAGGVLPHFSAKSYASILGSNNRLNVSMMGVNSRGKALAKKFWDRTYEPGWEMKLPL